MNLIDKYIAEVGKHLPRKRRTRDACGVHRDLAHVAHNVGRAQSRGHPGSRVGRNHVPVSS